MDFREIYRGDEDSIISAPVRGKLRAVVNTLMNFRVIQNSGNFLTS